MFEQQFGLKKRPFASQASGADVFIGPLTVGLVTRAKKIYAEPDAVISVFGPVGSGKTTLVHRALSALERQHTIITIGRIRLGPDEVIEFLLRELGLKQMPAGTIQKLTVFRNVLKKLADNDIRLFVIVEDAERLGNVALAELEALTATDSGVSDGASLVLMSENPLKDAFKAPGLTRLRQRTRLHYEVKPMTAPEVRGMLTNGLRRAGGDISEIIDDDAIVAIHALSDGIPRVVNGLVCSALDAVAEKGTGRLDVAEVKRVAAEEYGLELDDLDARIASSAAPLPQHSEPAVAAAPAPEPAPQPQPVPEPLPEPAVAGEAEPPIDDTQPTKILGLDDTPDEVPELIHDTLPEVAALDSGEYPIPELIQDTLPDLEVLAPELAQPMPDDEPAEPEPEGKAPEPVAESAPEPDPMSELIQDTIGELPVLDDVAPAIEPAAAKSPVADQPAEDDIPTLFESSSGMQPPTAAEAPRQKAKPAAKPKKPAAKPKEPAAKPKKKDVPAWDRDPTMAELKPDLEALEHAMAVAHGITSDDDADKDDADAESKIEEVPEITLDDSIRRKIDIAEEALKATQSLEQLESEMAQSETLSSAAGENTGTVPTRADEELERIAAELAKAKTIEDVDDKMAETLFGEEFSLVAAELAANAPQAEPEEPAVASGFTDEDLSLAATGSSLQSPAAKPPTESQSHSLLDDEFENNAVPDAADISIETPKGGMDMSASQRLATVRALNANTPPVGGRAARGKKPPNVPEPDPIEDQIDTSITETLKTLSPQQFDQLAQEEDEDEKKSGFFSRFRKS